MVFSSLLPVTRSLLRLSRVRAEFKPGESSAGRITWQAVSGPRVVRFEQTEFALGIEFNGQTFEYALNAPMPSDWMNWLDWLKAAPLAVA
jgi:hypothetical protein